MECQTRPSSLSVRGGGRCVQEQMWMVDGGMSGRVTRWGHNQIIAVFMNVTNNKNRSLGQSTQISTRMSAIGTKSHLLNRWFDDHLRKKTDNYYYTVEEEEKLLFGLETERRQKGTTNWWRCLGMGSTWAKALRSGFIAELLFVIPTQLNVIICRLTNVPWWPTKEETWWA